MASRDSSSSETQLDLDPFFGGNPGILQKMKIIYDENLNEDRNQSNDENSYNNKNGDREAFNT